jgi:hypothetical protein
MTRSILSRLMGSVSPARQLGTAVRAGEGRRSGLPGEAPSAEVAKDSQHNNDDDDDPKPGRHMILSSGVCRVYARSGQAERLGGFDHEYRLFVTILPRGGSRYTEHSISTKWDLARFQVERKPLA